MQENGYKAGQQCSPFMYVLTEKKKEMFKIHLFFFSLAQAIKIAYSQTSKIQQATKFGPITVFNLMTTSFHLNEAWKLPQNAKNYKIQ